MPKYYNTKNRPIYWANYLSKPIGPQVTHNGAHDIAEFVSELKFLKTLGSKLCKRAKVSFVVCDIGNADEGRGLLNLLQSISPAGTNIEMAHETVGFYWGEPVAVDPAKNEPRRDANGKTIPAFPQ